MSKQTPVLLLNMEEEGAEEQRATSQPSLLLCAALSPETQAGRWAGLSISRTQPPFQLSGFQMKRNKERFAQGRRKHSQCLRGAWVWLRNQGPIANGRCLGVVTGSSPTVYSPEDWKQLLDHRDLVGALEGLCSPLKHQRKTKSLNLCSSYPS